jgi:hypothetical protein
MPVAEEATFNKLRELQVANRKWFPALWIGM